MADIEMVIKIPESAYDYLSQTVDCIANGIPLPKGQGRLIERVLNAAETLKQKMGHWIPVSERLPERSVWVLAYCKTKDGYEYQTVLLLAKYNGEWTDCDDFCDDVIAWMPLPEPYKAESEDDLK